MINIKKLIEKRKQLVIQRIELETEYNEKLDNIQMSIDIFSEEIQSAYCENRWEMFINYCNTGR